MLQDLNGKMEGKPELAEKNQDDFAPTLQTFEKIFQKVFVRGRNSLPIFFGVGTGASAERELLNRACVFQKWPHKSPILSQFEFS